MRNVIKTEGTVYLKDARRVDLKRFITRKKIITMYGDGY